MTTFGEGQGIDVPQRVNDAVLAFINAHSWEEKQEIVEEHLTVLLGDLADLVLQAHVALNEGDADVVAALEEDRAVLADCRAVGVAEAFAPRVRPDPSAVLTPEVLRRLHTASSPEEAGRFLILRPSVMRVVVRAVASLLDASGLAGKRAVMERERDVLLTPAGEIILSMHAENARPEEAESCQWHAELLAAARKDGIDKAFIHAGGNAASADQQEALADLQEALAADLAHVSPQLRAIVEELIFAQYWTELDRRIDLCRRGLALVDRGSDLTLWRFFQMMLADCLLDTGGEDRAERLEEAIACYQAVMTLAREEDNASLIGHLSERLANVYRERTLGGREENLEVAIEHAEQALSILADTEERRDRVLAHFTAAAAYNERITGRRGDNLRVAHEHCIKALTLVDRDNDPREWMGIQLLLGAIAKNGGPDDAGDGGIGPVRAALDSITSQDQPDDWVIAQQALAEVYMARGFSGRSSDIESALAALNDALTVVGDRRPEAAAQVHSQLAEAYFWRIGGDAAGNIELAIAHAQAALRLFTPDRFPDQWAEALSRLADGYRSRMTGNPLFNTATAADLYHRLADFYAQQGPLSLEAKIHQSLGGLYVTGTWGPTVDQFRMATQHLRRALELYEQEQRVSNQAYVHANLFTISVRSLPPNLPASARTELERAALYHAECAMEVFTAERTPVEWGNIQLELGDMYWGRAGSDRQSDLRLALRHYESAVATMTPEAAPVLHVRALLGVADIQAKLGDWDSVTTACQRAITTGEALVAAADIEESRRALLPWLATAYGRAAYAVLQADRWSEGLRLLEQGKGRLLLDALTPEVNIGRLPESERWALQHAHAKVGQLQAEFDNPAFPGRRSDAQLGRLLHVARAELAEALAAARQRHSDPVVEGAASADPTRLLPAEGGVVAPLVTPQGTAVFVMSAKDVAFGGHNVVMLDGLNEAVVHRVAMEWRDGYSGWQAGSVPLADWTAIVDRTTAWLWSELMAPVHDRLQQLGVPTEAPVTLLPTGMLNLLPLHAAWRPVGGGRRAFLDDYTPSYAPSLWILDVCRTRATDPRRRRRSAAFFADSNDDLPYARQEAEAISRLFRSEDTALLSGEAVTLEAVVDAVVARGYIHFACHAFFNWLQSSYSGIRLAGHTFLIAGELPARLDLSASRLVSLSACESGISDLTQTGAESLGLPAALLRAGAAGAVLSLWTVHDHPTSLLMRRLYGELLDGGLEPAAALRSAQRWLRDATIVELDAFEREAGASAWQLAASRRRWRMLNIDDGTPPYANPHFWGAFALVGA
jgi:CHAT domain-containing protein/tetratricopeptide (TPR) repeat protein